MDTDLKALSAVYAFVLIRPGSALCVEQHKRVGYIPLVTEWDGPVSNLTAAPSLVDAAYVSQFDTRRKINVIAWAAVAGAGGSIVIGAESANIYNSITDLLQVLPWRNLNGSLVSLISAIQVSSSFSQLLEEGSKVL